MNLFSVSDIWIVYIAVAVILAGLIFVLLVGLSRYKKCPSDKIMVIYGKVGNNTDGTARSCKCIHGGAAFVLPIIQQYAFLDLTPMTINIDLKGAMSKQTIRVNVPSRFTVGISTEPGIMQNAAERLLGLRQNEITELAKDIILGQLRLVVALMDIDEISENRDLFLEAVARSIEAELKKIGMRLINANIVDVTDDGGYLDAKARMLVAKIMEEATRTVAERNKNMELINKGEIK